MPREESKQNWITRNRPPRVQITYDVEVGDAVAKKELPYVVGVLADLGWHATPKQPLKARKFVEIDRDNFDAILGDIAPKLSQIEVKNQLGGDAPLKLDLEFAKMADFRPEQLVTQVNELAQLMETRQRLTDLLAKLDGNDALETVLKTIATTPDELSKLLPPPADATA